MSKSLVNYIPAVNQQVFEDNYKKIKSKPYAQYFLKDMYVVDEEVKKAQNGPIHVSQALKPIPEDLNKLLNPGYLEAETGYCQMPDGTLYSASLTFFPGCTPEMLQWWFWWHSVESERYTLWYPYCHISSHAKNKDTLTKPGLTHEDRYKGNTHIITEYLYERKNNIEIAFVDPSELGIDTSHFPSAKILASACGFVSMQMPGIEFCTMIHLARETQDGFELRSRYYIGHNVKLKILGREWRVNKSLSNPVLKLNHIGLQTAYEQVMHDQIEFTHLASILPDLYNKFS